MRATRGRPSTMRRARALTLACTVAFAALALAFGAHAQPSAAASADTAAIGEPAFEAIGDRQGLSSHSIYAALVDRDGFVWFAGDNGLHRFDGRELHTLDRDP